MSKCKSHVLGADPINIKWNVVRGDTAKLKVEFLDENEIDSVDFSNWEFLSTAYDFKNDLADELEVNLFENYVEIVAPAEITENWGSGFRGTVGELAFDLQITIEDDVWTPIVGVISVNADVSGGSL
jgi:hypothetical protein